MNAVEAFAGAGGAALGIAEAGFRALALLEWDHAACETLRAADYGVVFEGDVRKWLPPRNLPRVDLLWSSPPCQAWSMAGSRKGARDERNGWPWHWALVDRLTAMGRKPTWILAENVKGMLIHASKANCGKGKHPNPMDCPACYWHEIVVPEALARYAYVGFRVLDAADYGVPQRRHRVILACGPHEYAWPEPTHSQEALVHAKWVTGSYWREHGLPGPVGAPSREEERLLRHGLDGSKVRLQRWRTIRDALNIFAWAPSTTFSGGGRVGVPRGVDTPSAQPLATPKAMGGLCGWHWPIRHQSPSAGTIQRPPDEPAMAVGGKGVLFAEAVPVEGSENRMIRRGVLGGAVLGEQLRGSPKDLKHYADNSPMDARWAGLAPERGRGITERHGPRRVHPLDEAAPSIAAGSKGSGPRQDLVTASHDHYADNSPMDARYFDAPAPTVTGTEVKGTRAGPASGYTMSGGPDRASAAAWLATGRRRLEPAECAALQSFPPGYPFKGTKTAQYTQIGNAVPPPLAWALANAIVPE